jgi:nucleotide-binding universal stress UspA family protein
MDCRNINLERILVATDGSKFAAAALQQAIWLARRCGAAITVAHLSPDVSTALDTFPVDTRHGRALGKTEALGRTLWDTSNEPWKRPDAPPHAVRMRHQTMVGAPVIEIIHAVQAEHYDLVIAGVRGLAPRRRFLAGNAAERLVRQCPCPVWLVQPDAAAPLRSILAAVNCSEVSGRALEYAGVLARWAACRLTVLHVFSVPFERAIMFQEGTTAAEMRQYRREVRRTAAKRLRQFAEAHLSPDGTAQLRVMPGEPSSGIVSVSGLLIGNTAETVLHSCDRSILAVKPEGFVSPIQPAAWSREAVDSSGPTR